MNATKILIVEDNPIVAEDLKTKLVKLGYPSPAIAYSGEKAIELTTTLGPDLLLMDIQLGDGISGIDTANQLEEQHRIAIIYITAHADDDTVSKAKLTRPYGYLIKPFTENELKSVLEIAVHKQQADKKVRESEERFRALYQHAPLPYQSLDESGNLIEVNSSWMEQLGYSKEEVIGKSFADFLHPNWIAHFHDNFPRFKSVGEVLGVEFKMRKKDGSYIWVEFNGKIRRNRDGTFVQTHCVFNDITEQRRLQEEVKKQEEILQQAQKMESIGTLAGGIAHDFNNIMSIIIGNNELLSEELPDDSPLRAHVEEIRLAGLRARDVVRQLLTFSRRDDAQKIFLDISTVIQESLKLIRSIIPTNIDIKLNISENVDPILGNETQINQVLINLCSNAKDAIADTGGEIIIGLRNIDIKDPENDSNQRYPAKKCVELTVEDNGCGMEQDVLKKIFEPYYTTKEIGKGTGIGLAVTHGIIEKHQGTISVTSSPLTGTRFSIIFPSHLEAITTQTQATRLHPRGNETILFVDDEEPLLNLGVHTLQGLGYTVKGYIDPTEALAIFQNNPNEFDLVITDMAMPNLTGDKLSTAILKLRPDIPIIICTGYSETLSREDASKIGITAYATKPVNRSELATLIREVLEDYPPSDSDN